MTPAGSIAITAFALVARILELSLVAMAALMITVASEDYRWVQLRTQCFGDGKFGGPDGC